MMLVRLKLLQIALSVYIVSSTMVVSGQKEPEIECDRKTHFECSDGSACIVKSYLCNGVKDCKNNEDEENCGEKLCQGESFFKCRDGGCISKSLICDNEANCFDASDESDELCEGKSKRALKCDLEKQFECSPGVCIPIKYVCNGEKNCLNGLDEDAARCSKMNVSCAGFMCKDGNKCLPSSFWECDGVKDCKDGSDEDHCLSECKLEDGNFMCTDGSECLSLSKVCDEVKDCPDGSDESNDCKTNSCRDTNCNGECKVLPSGAKCICKSGYAFSNDTKKCEDINECNIFGTCTQGCVNTNGSFYCTCANNFKLKNDNHTCIALGSDAILMYTTSKSIKSIYLNAHFVKEIHKTKQAIGLAYDGQSVFWTDVTDGKESIIKWTQGISKMEILLTAGLETPEDLAIDWLTGNIYFTDANLTRVAVCTSSGYFCTQLVSTDAMDKPRSIALHPAESLMFWTDWGQSPHLGVAFMDGSGAKILVENMKWPNGITLDWPNGRLYWTDAKLGTIESVTINGNDRRVILADLVKHPFSIAVFEDKLYWSDWDTLNIESCNKFTGKDFEPLVQGEYVYDVHIYHEAIMPLQNHACSQHKCSHICLLGPNRSFKCACPENMELFNDFSCQQSKKTENIILGFGKHVVAVPHQTFGRHLTSDALEVGSLVDVMAFNSITGEIFIAESKFGRIISVDIKNQTESILVDQHVLSVKAMAFDYLANNLYWIDNVKLTIEVISIKNKKRTIVLHFSKDDNLITFALVPSLGEMFIAFQSPGHVHIDKQLMNGGQDHFHVIESGLSNDGQINIVVDESNRMIYWSDSEKLKIEFSNFEGTNIKSFVRSDRKPGVMALIGGNIYWTSLGSKTLQWRNVTGSGGVKMVNLEKPPGMRKLPNLIAIAAGVPLKVSNHSCTNDNGGCSDICVSSGLQKFNCLCETGHYFKDASRRICIKRNDCGFICSTSGECLELSQKCNGKPDCLDGSDERDCDKTEDFSKCSPSQFKCKDGLQCIPQSQRCDGNNNCRDYSDEMNCTIIEKTEHCRSNQLRCPNGHCLDVSLRCEGHDDCGDKFDESQEVCDSSCPDDFFKCSTGQCIPKNFVCNSFIDCVDLSDEHAECPMQMCKSNQRLCPNAWCIDIQLFCNGFPDCQDGFDELGCENNQESKMLNSTCDEDEFACTSEPNQCYTIGMKCDGKNDCRLGEDEKNCPNCPPHQFECQNGRCIVEKFYCDGSNDCGDSSDEMNCGNKTSEKVFDIACEADQFKCKDGACLDYSKVCDGKKHCKNGDDEDNEANGKCKTACKSTFEPCEDICLPSPSGAVCSCGKGFQLSNGKYCKDINECLSNPCSQNCKNLNGSFVCTCNENFILGSDRTTCKAMGSHNFFLFALFDQIRTFTEFPKSISVFSTESFPIADIDVNVARNKIIYTLLGKTDLIEMDMENNATKISFDRVALASKITHDWITGNTYTVHHADDFKVKINVCSMKTRNCALIESLDYHEQITAIRVDPINKFIFYAKLLDVSVLEPVSKIIRMRLDGSRAHEIAKGSMIKSLAIDIDQQRVYFTETLTQTLFVTDYAGEQNKSLITQSRMIRRPISMALFENHAYIIQQASQMISRCKLYGNMECHTFDILANSVRQIVIGHATNQKSGPNNCENDSCEVVCIPSDPGFRCLSTNGTIVEPLAAKRLLMAETPHGFNGFWTWTLIILILSFASAAAVFLMYRRQDSNGRFNVSMYFRNNEMGKVLSQDTKPTPFPRTGTAEVTQAISPSVNTLNRNCHEFVNDGHDLKPMAVVNLGSSNVSFFSHDEMEDTDNEEFSNDLHQRLIL